MFSFSRLTDKTLSLNFAAALEPPPDTRLIWFGLIDSRDHLFGLDSWVLDVPLYFFHFKTSTRVERYGRRFELGHAHLERLRRAAAGERGRAFYVLPAIGTQEELVRSDLLERLWLLDVSDIPNMSPSHRRYGAHLVHLTPPLALLERNVQLPVSSSRSRGVAKGKSP